MWTQLVLSTLCVSLLPASEKTVLRYGEKKSPLQKLEKKLKKSTGSEEEIIEQQLDEIASERCRLCKYLDEKKEEKESYDTDEPCFTEEEEVVKEEDFE